MSEKQNQIKIKYLAGLSTIIIERDPKDNFFVSNNNQFMISKSNLAHLLSFLLHTGIISESFIRGILEEYNTL